MKENRTVVASGYFDPIHVGHIEYLEMAAKLGDKLIVIVNNDRHTGIWSERLSQVTTIYYYCRQGA